MLLQENKLYNVVLICLSQHCTRKLPLQCWPTAHKQCFTEEKYTVKHCLDLSGPKNHVEINCAKLAQSAQIYFHRKPVFWICLVACFLSSYIVTEQSWLFLFNVSLGVHLWLPGQQWTGANIDWNIIIDKLFTYTYISTLLFWTVGAHAETTLLSSCLFLKYPVLRWSWLECQIFMNFSSWSCFLQTRFENLN